MMRMDQQQQHRAVLRANLDAARLRRTAQRHLEQAHRLALGVPEGADELGDILWLETNAVELNGVSFTKGCYVGQENTARMNWRQKVNRRLVVVPVDQSDPARQRAAYPDLGLAVDHRRVEDIKAEWLPEWLKLD